MDSEYILIKENTENYKKYLNFNLDGKGVAVYLNGLRLFLNEDYSISDRWITLKNPVKANDRIVVSYP